ncbi:MAG: cation:proton antiporter [Actinobacteria bacterium]|nr:cation:proton antiporter [Actinomycetota bacterium]
MLATSGSVDLGRLLLDLLIVLAAAKLAAEIAERLFVAAVLGEIAAGILLGPSVFGLIETGGDRGVSIALLAEIGVLLLLLSVGMEMDLAELVKVGRASLLVAVVGVAAPFAAGTATGLAFGESTDTSIFFGAALTATSVGITARVFGDLRALASIEARIVLGAAVADDVLGLVILTVVVKAVTGAEVGVGVVAVTLGSALAFLMGTGVVGLVVVPPVLRAIDRLSKSSATLPIAALALTLAFAALADASSLAFIIGAFVAGLAIGRSEHREHIARDLASVGNVFIPIFFLQIGLNADIAAMAKPSVLTFAAVMSAVAVGGKLLSAVGAIGTRADKLLLGIGMIPRGEVGLIFASIGLTSGVLDADLYGALLLVVLLTTIATPPLLRLRLGATEARPAKELDTPTEEPPQGWITIEAGVIELHGTPPSAAIVHLALTTAKMATLATPGESLLNWFSARRHDSLSWNPDETPTLVDLLRSDEVRAWRFLEVTGVLERALPEVAAAMARRRADMSDLDPLSALRFPTVDRLHELTSTEGSISDRDDPHDSLVLAAMVHDVCRAPDEALFLASRLCRESDALLVVSLISDANLFRAGLREPPAFENTEIFQLATHLAGADHAHDAYMLALTLGDLPKHHRDALEQRYALVCEALDHPELTGTNATNLAGIRRVAAQRLLTDEAAIERLRVAPASYLLTHEPEEIARHAELVEPLPRAGVVRVAVSAQPMPDYWKVDIACRDADGLLARLTDVLTAHGFDITSADIATWPDGAVLDSFSVRSEAQPDANELATSMEARLRKPLRATPKPQLELTFDNAALPWHTSCIVNGRDEQGVLQAVSAAFAATKVVVHSARIGSLNGNVSDRFTVTDRLGRKLDLAAMNRTRAALNGTDKTFTRTKHARN